MITGIGNTEVMIGGRVPTGKCQFCSQIVAMELDKASGKLFAFAHDLHGSPLQNDTLEGYCFGSGSIVEPEPDGFVEM